MRFAAKIKEKIISIKEKAVFLLLLSQTLMYTNTAHAQSGPFSPTDGDLSVKMLGKLFGGLVGGGSDPLKDLITTFNGAILAVGGILVAYTIFAGTIGTAHEGQMLGKKFSSVWIPIRTAVGAALVVPINGYCAMQMIVMWLIMQGIGLADTVWSAAVNGNAIMNGTITAFSAPPAISELAVTMLNASVCTVAAQKNSSEVLGNSDNWGKEVKTTDGVNEIVYGNQSRRGMNNACGTVQLLDEGSKSTGIGNFGDFKNVQGNMKGSSNTTNFIKIQNDAAKAMADSLHSAAQNLVAVNTLGTVNGIASKMVVSVEQNYSSSILKNAVRTYNETIKNAMTNYFANDKDANVLKNMTEEGWIMAGAWFIKQGNVMSQANVGLTSIPTASSATSLRFGPEFKEVNSVMNNFKGVITFEDSRGTSISKQNTLDSEDSDGWTARLGKMLGGFVTGIDIDNLAEQTNVHPIIQMKQMGDKMITGSISGITISIALAATIGAAGGNVVADKFGGGTAALSAALLVAPVVFTCFAATMSLGFFMSYYIPMLPFLIWLGCLVGWFILVVEAIIAAPLWAVMHLHPNGDDVTGRGGQGYMLVLGLLVRPTLMIFGLICALILSGVIGQFINSLFYDVFVMSRMGEKLSFFSIIFAYIIYTAMMLEFVKKMFAVIHIIPDQLLRWMGGGSEQLGQYAGALTQGTEGQFMKAGAGLGYIGNQGTNAGMQALQKGHMSKLQREQTANDNRIANERQTSEASQAAGLTVDQASALAGAESQMLNAQDPGGKAGAGFTAARAAQAMSAARQPLEMAGATPAQLAKFNATVASAEGGSLSDKIASAQSDFYDDKFGAGAGQMIMGAGGGDTNRQATAADKLADAQASMAGNPGQFKKFISDVNTAVNQGTSGNFNNSNAASTLANYKSSHGLQFDDSQAGSPNAPASNYAAAINAMSHAYNVNSGPSDSQDSSMDSSVKPLSRDDSPGLPSVSEPPKPMD